MELVSKQVALSGRLKPEPRLGLAISEFAQSLDEKRRREFRSMQNAGSIQISGRDVIKVTEEINLEGARRHGSWRPHGTKVGGFLSRIQTFANIGDVLIGGSQNLIATGVWSAVRLSLSIATNYLSYFEKLSTLFMKLGTSWTLHEDFAQLFPRSEVLQAYFCEYLVVLMKLCNKVVIFGQKNTGAQLFSSLGSSFDSEFGAVQKELDQWGLLIQQQTQLLSTKMAAGAEDGRIHDLKQRVLRRLSPHQNDFETRWRRQRRKGTCEWIFETPGFKHWKAMQRSAAICVSGKLGSGKTVSMANIVARMDLEQPCAYAFCASQEPSSLKATNILGSVAFNLLENLPTENIAWREVEERNARIKCFDPDSIVDFILEFLRTDKTYIIIADGLEDSSGDDVTDVFHALRRLMQHRVILLCYSSRSDSKFHYIAKQHLEPEFFISHDDLKHDDELEAYILEEISRRNATRQLSPDLEELVKKQLIAGAQGMYLWASLQLDTIFPANSKVVVMDNQIFNLIANLPKDLPEAFERALESITDRRYGGRIMKLVMSAVTPLDLDEIRVALCVVPGELVWHPEKIAKDGRQLITLCGGNLLDLDEEDGKVRFIHHSVIQHLLSPATSQITMPYHFAVEDAENFIGAICVTYLQLPIFDSRMTVTKNLQSQQVLDNVVETTRLSLPIVSRLVEHIKSREYRRARNSGIDIGHILTKIQAPRVPEDLDSKCFAHYATNHWEFHTRFFDEEDQDCEKSWKLWWRMFDSRIATIKPPCPSLELESSAALLWAVEQAHGALFRFILSETSLRLHEVVEVVHALALHKSIHGKHLGDLLAQYLQSLSTIAMPSTANSITLLLELGASVNARHHISESKPLEILAHRIYTDDLFTGEINHIVRTVLTHSAIQESIEDRDILKILEGLLRNAQVDAITAILAFRPDLRFKFEAISASKISESQKLGKPNMTNFVPLEPKLAIQRSLGLNNWKEVESLALQGRVNVSTSSSTSLLWIAIETMNDEWVRYLLSIGADPNAGPFTMASLRPAARYYPLQAALWLRRTRVCLELLDHGADIVRLGKSPMKIARMTDNSILIAKLYETSHGVGRRRVNTPQDMPWHGRTALATACEMLPLAFSHPCLYKFSNSTRHYNVLQDGIAELDKIIYLLAEDEDTSYTDFQDKEGKTALHYVAQAPEFTSPSRLNSFVHLLLSRGAEPNLADFNGKTPIDYAMSNPAPLYSMIQPLLTAGAKPNQINKMNRRLLLEKAINEYPGPEKDVIKLVSILLQAGADPRDLVQPAIPDPDLMESARKRRSKEIAEALVERTAKLNKQDLGYQNA